jgi:hypothetical protein
MQTMHLMFYIVKWTFKASGEAKSKTQSCGIHNTGIAELHLYAMESYDKGVPSRKHSIISSTGTDTQFTTHSNR